MDSSLGVGGRRPSWTLNLYAEAAEAGGCLWMPPRSEPSGRPVDPERSQLEARRRARRMVRRYCAANRLNRLGTLTYAGEGCHDPGELRADVGSFFKGLRGQLGAKPIPYLWVPEWDAEGSGRYGAWLRGFCGACPAACPKTPILGAARRREEGEGS